MTRARITSRIVVPALTVAAASATTLGLAAGTASATTGHTAAGTSTSPPVVFNCLNHAQVRPRDYVLTCADANTALVKLSWATWNRTFAVAAGDESVNLCQPNCAEGKIRDFPAVAVFWRSEPVPHQPGQKYFSRVTVVFPGARPPVYRNGKPAPGPRSWTGGLPS